MPHSPEDKKRVVTRLRRIKGQAEALERAVQAGVECDKLLQQLAALRGATTGLMAEVLDMHMRETFAPPATAGGTAATRSAAEADAAVDAIMHIVRSYVK